MEQPEKSESSGIVEITGTARARHREEAPAFAAMQADKQAEVGDMEGHHVWLNISSGEAAMNRTFTLVITLLFLGACQDTLSLFKAEFISKQTRPCSARYTESFALNLRFDDVGKIGVPGLFMLMEAQSGYHNLRVVEGDDRFPYVIQIDHPAGGWSRNFKAQFLSVGGISRGKTYNFFGDIGNEADEAGCLRYAVKFQSGFAFNKGGKLPGLFGGNHPTGGRKVTGRGFTTRYMWRRDGDGEVNGYVSNKNEPKFGDSIGRGSWHFEPGKWHILEQEIILNNPAKADGILRVWVDGRQVIEAEDIAYRKFKNVKVDGIIFSTFFGGGDSSWASPIDQFVQFSDFRTYRPNK